MPNKSSNVPPPNEPGGLVEYALILGLTAVVLIFILTQLGPSIATAFTNMMATPSPLMHQGLLQLNSPIVVIGVVLLFFAGFLFVLWPRRRR